MSTSSSPLTEGPVGAPTSAELTILPAQHGEGGADADDTSILRDQPDWTKFRNLETLGQKGGVPQRRIVETAGKEVTDNALDQLDREGLDAADHCRIGLVGSNGFFVENDGQGLAGSDEEIAALFSINRPYRSSKLVRTVSRGMLGNGLRFVAGAVLCSGGSIVVETRGRRLRLEPQHDDGTTRVTRLGLSLRAGTRIEVHLGPTLTVIEADLRLAQQALAAAACGGEVYKGKTSAFWYSPDALYELLQTAPLGQTVRQFVEGFEGCSGAKAGTITSGWHDRSARSLGRDEAARLLQRMQGATTPVKPGRLGKMGPLGDLGASYARVEGSRQDGIPYVIECWMRGTDKRPQRGQRVACRLLVNKSPVLSSFSGHLQAPGLLALFDSAGLAWAFKIGVRQAPASLVVNIQTPAIALTSEGKAPDLTAYRQPLGDVLAKCAKAARASLPGRRTEKAIVYAIIMDVMRVRSNNGKHTVTVRGLFYGIRPLIIAELGKEPEYSNFERIVAHYENDHGLIPGLTRDPRGSLYIPHEGLTIPLGTTAVAQFRRPAWTFNKILYIEKEGFFSLLIDERWPERHDCALMTSKGYTTRAVKDLIDLLGKDGEPITVYCVHDGDAAGTMIFQTLQEATTARAARRVTVVDLGLQPWEALALGLKGEEIKLKAGEEPKTRPVADYVRAYDREHGTTWAQTLQTRRYELDEMATTGDILAWLEGKFAGTAKVMPPPEVLEQHHLETEIKRVTAQIEQEAFTAYGRDEKVAEATRQLREDATRRAANKALLAAQVERGYERDRTQSWRAIVGSLPYELGGQDAPGTARKARRTRKTTRREGDDRS